MQAQRDPGGGQRNVAAGEEELTENEARREILVRAAQDGMVTAITAEPGQSVAGNIVLASVLPAGAELEAESMRLPAPSVLCGRACRCWCATRRTRCRTSASLRRRCMKLPAPRCGRKRWRSGRRHRRDCGAVYRIRFNLDRQTVLAYGADLPLKSGMLVDASVLLERRRLYEWVLEPLFTISGRF